MIQLLIEVLCVVGVLFLTLIGLILLYFIVILAKLIMKM